jgi:dipeptidase D
MLNIDSEEEGILLVSCAGGVTVTCNIPIERKSSKGKVISIIVTGLQGGHSGVEIDKGRANSNQLMGRILEEMSEDIEFNIIDINGGKKDNAIPKETVARIMISDKDVEKAYSIIEDCERVFKEEYLENDKDITILKQESFDNAMIMSDNCTTKVIQALLKLPEGVIKMSEDIQGLVQTSLNMGILVTKENMVTMSFSVRSSVGEEKEILVNQIKNIIEDLGGNIECTGNYPAWEYKKDSDLRRLMVDIYREQTGKEAEVQAIHAGVECGLFAGKISNLDCVSFGPDIFDIHTTKERLSISSVERTWKYLLEILRSLR